jgi:hypothetical protein
VRLNVFMMASGELHHDGGSAERGSADDEREN